MTTREARQMLVYGLDAEMAELRRLRPIAALAEIVFFSALWTIGIVLDCWAPGRFRIAGIAASAAALNAFYLLSHEGTTTFSSRTAGLNYAATSHSAFRSCIRRRATAFFTSSITDISAAPAIRMTTATTRAIAQAVGAAMVRLTMGTLVYMPLIPIVGGGARRDREMAPRLRVGVIAAVIVAGLAIVPINVLLQVG